MIIDKWIKLRGKKFPFVETPLSKTELSELQDDYRKFYIHDHKQDKVYPVYSNRVSHTYKIDIGERGMYYIGMFGFSFLFLLYLKKKIKKKVNQYNPFGTSKEMEEFLNNIENKTPDHKDVNST